MPGNSRPLQYVQMFQAEGGRVFIQLTYGHDLKDPDTTTTRLLKVRHKDARILTIATAVQEARMNGLAAMWPWRGGSLGWDAVRR